MDPGQQVRVLFLMMVLTPLVIWAFTDHDPRPDWDRTQVVVIYPYNVNGSEAVDKWLASLDAATFHGIEQFMSAESGHYGLALDRPFEIHLADPIDRAPPTPPTDRGLPGHLRWALGLRWWHLSFDRQGHAPDIIILARFQGETEPPFHRHSIGMPRPRLALVSQIAADEMIDYNNVVMAHELLHTVGATDLYEPETQLPIFPAGYVDPDRNPPWPQTEGELMAMQTPVAPTIARELRELSLATIGLKSASEIGWIEPGAMQQMVRNTTKSGASSPERTLTRTESIDLSAPK